MAGSSPSRAPSRSSGAAGSSCRAIAATSSTASSSARRRASPIRNACSPPTARRRRRSTCCALSPRAAMPICTACTAGTSASSPTARWASATASWPTRSPTRSPSWKPPGSTGSTAPTIARTEFYTSHEALLLGYEQAMTRVDSTSGDWYEHRRAHGVDRRPHPPARRRPCRVRPRHRPTRSASRPARRCRPTPCCGCSDILDPDNRPGRVTVISRMGRAHRRAPAPTHRCRRTRGPDGGVVVRSDARQHRSNRRTATRRGRSTASSPRRAASSRSTTPRGATPAASMSR